MTLALALRWRRATHRHLCSYNDATRFPEALLIAVFERYYVILRTVARYGSSVPGPMENRRRIGKRQMGELNFGQSHPASPLWALENLPDLTRWKWKPPSPPNALLQRSGVEKVEGRSMIQSVLGWFAGRVNPAPDTASDDIGDQLTRTPDIIEQPLQKIVWDAQTSPPLVIKTGLELLFRDLSSDATDRTRPNFTGFCDNWRMSLASGIFSSEAICSILDGIQNELSMLQSDTIKPLKRIIADAVMLSLLKATTRGLSHSGVHKHNDSDLLVWGYILRGMSKLQINTLGVLAETMANIPERHLVDMPTNILENLCANLNTYLLASGRERERSSLIRQAGQMATILRSLNLAKYPQILQRGTLYVSNYMARKTCDYDRVRYSWLQLLARLPNIDFNYLIAACFVLESGRYARPLSNREICEMYLARHRSTVVDAPTVANTLTERIPGERDELFYGYFILALWRTKQFDHVKAFCNFLEKLGRHQDIMRLAKAFRNLVKNEVRPLVNLTIGVRQPLLAIEILSLYEKSRTGSKKFWQSKSSTKVLKLLTRSPSLRQTEILRALRIKYRARRNRIRYRLATKRQILKATKAARAVALSPIISPRASLTLITHCTNYLQSFSRAVIPTPVLRALLHIVTRDLARGEPGRTSRIRWVLGLLHKHVSRDKMIRIGLGIRRWRELNNRCRRESAG
ncbi:uncharacterized protein F4807DRAFT_452598 [Annulohypoxylon truncatum]|uniref:uncharacterized protein n=1 Tax=Annulohypoxylon truncatum TaxID=327061 RepID=UPI00200743B0|nr:uncharacterized protein F4807DRAFT_452598 [Annulohypoxylon truncatum]KAI1208089.1 hypothetical protein F4807DRAFT_452598 [Annulohypoxylon truncatum]